MEPQAQESKVSDLYPGALANADDLLRLAGSYHDAANLLAANSKRRNQLSRAPYRFLAIHAIELYLNAWLIHRGLTPSEIRKLSHNLGTRADLAVPAGLALRSKTLTHLRRIGEFREYLVARYDTRMDGSLSQLNRLEATLAEVSKKVSATLSSGIQQKC